MDRGRRATLEERIAIVKYTLDHCNDYREAAKHFNVSYPQVYTCTKISTTRHGRFGGSPWPTQARLSQHCTYKLCGRVPFDGQSDMVV